MNQNEKIAAKVVEIQASLEAWSAEEGILGPGETIEFSLNIKTGSYVSFVKKAYPVEQLIKSTSITAFKEGQFVAPAALTEEEIDVIRRRLTGQPRRQFIILMKNKNEAISCSSAETGGINKALREPVGGKFYRLARSAEEGAPWQGMRLFEVELLRM